MSLLLSMCGCASKKDIPNFETKNSYFSGSPINWPWRGISIVSHDTIAFNPSDIDKLASYGVNFVRLRLSFRKLMESEKLDFNSAYIRIVNWALHIINKCEMNHIDVMISHSDFPVDPNKKFNQSDARFWENPNEIEQVLNLVDDIVQTFDTCAAVKAYQFIAEPVSIKNGKSKQPKEWLNCFEQIRKRVRNRSEKFLVYSSGPWGKTDGYKDMEKPFNDTAIIYNFHFYEPHCYTHQKIGGYEINYSYPDTIGGTCWSREKLAEKIDIFQSWRIKHNIKYALAGEFSTVRWARGKDKYLSDIIELLEERGISWAYFSYNGWKGWNYNYEYDMSGLFSSNNLIISKTETETLRLLKSYWQTNSN